MERKDGNNSLKTPFQLKAEERDRIVRAWLAEGNMFSPFITISDLTDIGEDARDTYPLNSQRLLSHPTRYASSDPSPDTPGLNDENY